MRRFDGWCGLLAALSLLVLGCGPGASDPAGDPWQVPGEDPVEETALFRPWTEVGRDTIRYGDTLESLLSGLGVDRSYLPGLVHEYDHLSDHRHIKPGEVVALLKHSSSDRLAFAHWLRPWKRIRIELPLRLEDELPVAFAEAGWLAEVDSLDFGNANLVIRGEIESSLYEAMIEAGGTPAMVLAYSDILQWDVDFFTGVRQGDQFQMVLEQRHHMGSWLNEPVLETGRILAATYIRTGDTLRACWFEGCGTEGYFDSAGKSFQKQFLKSPLNFRRISSRFGQRQHPVTRKISNHPGVDFAAPSGTPIVAPADGVVTTAGRETFYGRVLRIRHNERYTTVYGHLSGFARGIKQGSRVTQNQVIAFVGSTGRATGPHLHYEFHDRGRIIDPLAIRNDPAVPLPAECREAYDERFRQFWP